MSNALTQLDHYRLLGRSGLRVSPMCLGTMTFGEDWGWGSPEETSRHILDMYADRGGNFIDTANFYTNGSSETLLGQFLQGRRDRFVIATKYTLNLHRGDPNAGGNHRKSIVRNVEESLKRLQTDYIDLYYLHLWEYRTPIEEVMRALDDLVTAGKVLYVGNSDTPAWKVAQGNTIAHFQGWSPFIGLQIEYSLIRRDGERDLIPMAQDLGLGVLPWGPLHAGVLTGKYNPIDEKFASDNKRDLSDRVDDHSRPISEAVQRIALEIDHSPAQVALNWVMQQPGITSTIIGARKVNQLEDNLAAMEFSLSEDHLKQLRDVSDFPLGIPHDQLAGEFERDIISGGSTIEKGTAPHVE